jgi:hypothetical protein
MAKITRYERQNEKVIKAAFARLVKSKDMSIRMGMYRLLERAVKATLEFHDEDHQSHIEMGDTYGWMLVVNGRIDKIEVNAEAEKVGQASQMLRTYEGKVPNVGYVGVVMAGMQPANFFTINYEKRILESTIQITKYNFNQFFRKI